MLQQESSSKKIDATESTDEIFLDQNHTHFVLVDDGSENIDGIELAFRTQLESELRKRPVQKRCEQSILSERARADDQVPMVLIIVQGGTKAFLKVEEAVRLDVPVLVLAVSINYSALVRKKRIRH